MISPVLDHVTLRTHDLEATRIFFETVLELKPGYRPNFSFPGYWLYAGEEPIVHLIPGNGGLVDQLGETIDHVGFRLDGYETMRSRLNELHINYTRMDLAELGERRLFIHTPTGILVELIFRETRTSPDTSEQESKPAQ